MSESLLSAMDVKAAEKLMRHLGQQEALEAGVMTPMAGTRPVRLFSLAEAQSFLIVYEKNAVDSNGTWATINYVDPMHLARWIGDVLGDEALADALREIASSRKAYGFLVPDLKALIASRIEQARQVLGLTEPAAG